MTYIPDCRKDEDYNEKNLSGLDAEFVKGYDHAMEIMDLMFDNIDVYPDVANILDPNMAVVNLDKVTAVRNASQDWMEMGRNEMIVALIDKSEEKE